MNNIDHVTTMPYQNNNPYRYLRSSPNKMQNMKRQDLNIVSTTLKSEVGTTISGRTVFRPKAG